MFASDRWPQHLPARARAATSLVGRLRLAIGRRTLDDDQIAAPGAAMIGRLRRKQKPLRSVDRSVIH